MEMRSTVISMTEQPGADPIAVIAALSEPVRRRLYDYVAQQHDLVGRDAAAAALGIGRPLAAFHLDRLARDGLLDVEYRRRSGRSGPGAGRPAKLYRRSRDDWAVSLPPRRYGIAAELFARALESEGEPSVESMTAVAHAYGVGLARAARDASSAETRALADPGDRGELLSVLDDAGFEPDVDDAGAIRLRNCPFDALVPAHREITCGMNLAALQGVRDGLGSGNLTPARRTEPGYCCVAFEPVTVHDPHLEPATLDPSLQQRRENSTSPIPMRQIGPR
jgi:predicted ArsR family transcriptional regulator